MLLTAQEVAQKLNVRFCEASAKSAANVESIFQDMARAILVAAPKPAAPSKAAAPVGASAAPTSGGCC